MRHHALHCIDLPRAGGDLAEVDRIEGWCLASSEILSLQASLRGGGACEAEYGLARPDVARAFPGHPNGERCGFSIELPAGGIRSSADVALTLTLAGRLGRRRRHLIALDLSTNDARRAELRGLEPRLLRVPAERLEQRLRRSLEARPGITLRLDIINRCNLRCIMCHYSDATLRRRQTRKITVEEFRRFFATIGPMVRCVVLSCADEPLLSDQFPAIVSLIAEDYPHVEIELCTNATLLDANLRRLVVERGVTHMMVSLDGVTKATVERIRAGADYDRIVANLLALRDLKRAASARYPIVVMDYVMMTANLHEAPAFVELAGRAGAQVIDFRHVIPSEHFDDPEQLLRNRPAMFNHYRERVLGQARRWGLGVVIPPPFPTSDDLTLEHAAPVSLDDLAAVTPDENPGEIPIPRRFARGFAPRRTRGTAAAVFAKAYCERPFSEITILDQDEIKPCPWHHNALGRLGAGEGLDEVFFSDGFARLRQTMLRPEGDLGCRGCPVKGELLVSR